MFDAVSKKLKWQLPTEQSVSQKSFVTSQKIRIVEIKNPLRPLLSNSETFLIKKIVRHCWRARFIRQ